MANSKKVSKAKKKVAKKVIKKPKVASVKKTASKTKRKAHTAVVDPTTRQKMIEEMAYFHAQQRNFTAGNSIDDWLSAEIKVDKNLSKQ